MGNIQPYSKSEWISHTLNKQARHNEIGPSASLSSQALRLLLQVASMKKYELKIQQVVKTNRKIRREKIIKPTASYRTKSKVLYLKASIT